MIQSSGGPCGEQKYSLRPKVLESACIVYEEGRLPFMQEADKGNDYKSLQGMVTAAAKEAFEKVRSPLFVEGEG